MELLDHILSRRPYLTPADWELIKGKILGIIPEIMEAILILLAGYVIYKLTAVPLRKILIRSHVEEWLARIIAHNIYKPFVLVIAFVFAINQLGLHVGATLTGIGIVTIGLGLAAQDSLSNIVAGFLIFFDKPFRVGDYITINGHYGRIELITMRSTRIRTQDNTYVVVPNQKIINDVVVDHSTNGDTRIVIPVSITYESSIDEARAAILKEVATIEGVLVNPAPDVVVNKLNDSGVDLLVRVWIPNAAKERQIYFKTTETVKKTLDQAGIQIAYPHVELVGR